MRRWTRRAAQLWLIGRAWVLLTIMIGGLRLLQFRRFYRALASPAPRAAAEDLPLATAVARAVAAAAHYHPLSPTCLPRALTLWWLLRRRGLAAQFHIGARRVSATEIAAHAWVTHAGAVLNDVANIHEQYPPFDLSLLGGEPPL